MNVVCLIIALFALGLVLIGLVKGSIALTVTGQLLGVVALGLILSQLPLHG